jgi:hypothetical protein
MLLDQRRADGGQRLSQPLGIQVRRVARRSGLLAPGLIEASGVDRIEAQFVDQPHHRRLLVGIVAGHRERDPALASGGLAELQQVLGLDVVERLDHRIPELVGHPAAVRCTRVDRLNLAVAAGVVVARVDDRSALGAGREHPSVECRDRLLGDRDHHQLGAARGILGARRRGPGLLSQRAQRLGATRVRHRDRVTKLGQTPRQRAADVAGSDDPDAHAAYWFAD